jgi:glutamate--cysteine ligase
VRYLDTQPPGEWLAPVAVLETLLADSSIVAEAERLAAPAIGRWEAAARCGVADPGIALAARGLLTLAVENLAAGWPARVTVTDIIRRRLAETAGTTAGGAR